jgi:hypothetical protein
MCSSTVRDCDTQDLLDTRPATQGARGCASKNALPGIGFLGEQAAHRRPGVLLGRRSEAAVSVEPIAPAPSHLEPSVRQLLNPHVTTGVRH